MNSTTETASVVMTQMTPDTAHGSLITLDEYINKALPLHLQKIFLENLAKNQPSTYSKYWSFTQGLVVGQLSVLVAMIFFIKFFIFSEKSSASDGTKDGKRKHQVLPSALVKPKKKDGDKDNDEDNEKSQINMILEKTYYDVESHSPESLDWFNVLIAQTINQFREEALRSDNIVRSLNDFMATASLPEFLGNLTIKEIDIGHDFPILSNCRIMHSPNSNKRRLEAKMDIDLSDRLTLGIDTKLILNKPSPMFAVLPVELTVSIVRFHATLTVSLVSNLDDDSDDGFGLILSFSPDYRLEFEVKSLIGGRSKLENVPKIGALIEYQIRKWFVERCVEPRFQLIKLPNVWPRSKNTRKMGDEE